MLNLLKALRYLVFVVFVICNAIIASVAVWNLSIVESIAIDASAKQISSYLIFVGASGLSLIFPVIFFELYGKNVFVGRVWFELLWVCVFFVMELAGAAAITGQSSAQVCNSVSGGLQNPSFSQDSPCASTQVLQAFTWICTILLLGYFVLLVVSAIIRQREDPTIWHCSVRKFPWLNGRRNLKSVPTSPSLPRFRSQTPVIAAPRPRRLAIMREAILSYRSGLSSEYEVEHYQPQPHAAPEPVPANNRPVPPIPLAMASPPPLIRQQTQQAQQRQGPTLSTPFYPSYVRTAIDPTPQAPPPAQLGQIRRLPPSPPPLGDWPRLDATSRPPRIKRKPLPPVVPPASYSFNAPALSAALQPLASSPTRSRPTGPRRRSSSGEEHRPSHLDLSQISSFHTRGHS
ncbi:hypothetical protein B0H34DRAFT_312788 [Crassisporium funariophilum]|nr:hypothetical protein B0H34DRAFT_312788 [Crassisporium funariophilum]